tara:strand:- start:1773 stop:2324 length:552 start_codon:yes stop_codon:yes gene_type:complete
MKINENVIMLILLFLGVRWYLRNRNELSNDLQAPVVVDPTLSSNTNWNDGYIHIFNQNGGDFYIDPNSSEIATNGVAVANFVIYNDQGDQFHTGDYYLQSQIPLPPSGDYASYDIGWQINGNSVGYLQLPSGIYDFNNNFTEVFRGCLDINDPNYNANASYHVPQYDCFDYLANGGDGFYGIV